MMKLKFNERAISVLLLAVCALWLMYSPNISDATMPGVPGPKVFPFIIVGLLAALTILKEILTFRGPSRRKKPKNLAAARKVPAEAASRNEEAPDRKKVIFSFILVFLFVVGIDTIGFYPATLITVFVALKFILGISQWPRVLIGTAAITVSVFIIFTLIFQLPLPRGIF
jgi:hypothetical protein